MPDLDFYKRKSGGVKTSGQAHKRQSDNVMNSTWWNDIGAKTAYIYDYYHDDEPLIFRDLHPEKSKTKTPIDIKFIVNSYNSENKDQVGYHIQFRPGQKCPLDYYEESLGKKYFSEFPIACYLDIQDEQGIYRKWLVTEPGNQLGLQFPTYYILPIDHVFQWIHNDTKYQMCGIGRSQSSYNQGTWVDYKIESPENQRKAILPMNEISATIFYDTRIVLSAPIDEPITWRCTKVEQISPKGINRLTFAQARWDQHKDYIEKDEEGNVIGMWCNYFDNNLTPSPSDEPVPDKHAEITYFGVKKELKIGGSYKKFNIAFYKGEEETPFEVGTWKYKIDGKDATPLLNILTNATSKDVEPNQVKLKFLGDDRFIGKILNISYDSHTGVHSEIDIPIIAI